MICRTIEGEIHMTTYKISLMEAYLIETLRNHGVSNDEIVSKLKTGHVEAWQEFHERFDFKELLPLATKDIDQFKEMLDQGYQVKFVTFNGLKNLLRMCFGKEQDKDYELLEKGIHNLILERGQLETVKQMLSGNWVLEEEANGSAYIVRIELI